MAGSGLGTCWLPCLCLTQWSWLPTSQSHPCASWVTTAQASLKVCLASKWRKVGPCLQPHPCLAKLSPEFLSWPKTPPFPPPCHSPDSCNPKAQLLIWSPNLFLALPIPGNGTSIMISQVKARPYPGSAPNWFRGCLLSLACRSGVLVSCSKLFNSAPTAASDSEWIGPHLLWAHP